MGIDEVGIDKVGIDEVGRYRPLPPEERPGTHCLYMGVISPTFRVFVRIIIMQARRVLVGP